DGDGGDAEQGGDARAARAAAVEQRQQREAAEGGERGAAGLGRDEGDREEEGGEAPGPAALDAADPARLVAAARRPGEARPRAGDGDDEGERHEAAEVVAADQGAAGRVGRRPGSVEGDLLEAAELLDEAVEGFEREDAGQSAE